MVPTTVRRSQCKEEGKGCMFSCLKLRGMARRILGVSLFSERFSFFRRAGCISSADGMAVDVFHASMRQCIADI